MRGYRVAMFSSLIWMAIGWAAQASTGGPTPPVEEGPALGSEFADRSQPVRVPLWDSTGCYAVVPTGNFYPVVVVAVRGGPVSPGDEIAVRDGDDAVGSRIFPDSLPFVIAAWQGDPGHGLPGYADGHPIVVELCTAEGRIKLPGTVIWEQGGSYGTGTMSVAGLITFPWIGACCIGRICEVLTEPDCASLSGVYRGAGEPCEPDPCLTPADSPSWGRLKRRYR